jgi:hypothetical protein
LLLSARAEEEEDLLMTETGVDGDDIVAKKKKNDRADVAVARFIAPSPSSGKGRGVERLVAANEAGEAVQFARCQVDADSTLSPLGFVVEGPSDGDDRTANVHAVSRIAESGVVPSARAVNRVDQSALG